MRISDWSSDVCSSDLQKFERVHLHSLADAKKRNQTNWPAVPDIIERAVGQPRQSFLHIDSFCPRISHAIPEVSPVDCNGRGRSEERRVGKGCGRTGNVRWSQCD